MAKQATARMEEFEDVEELRENVRAFRDSWSKSPKLMERLSLFRRAPYWVHDPSSGGFANAKFAGYKGMTAKKYELALYGPRVGYFTGGVNRKIARRLRQTWRPDKDLSVRLEEFATSLAGADAVLGIDRSKWQFVVLPSLPNALDNRSPAGTRKHDERDSLPPGDPDGGVELVGLEGGKRLVSHIRTERDSALPIAVKRQWASSDPDLGCIVCGFSFSRTYGRLGQGFIEAHHRQPLATRHQSSKSRDVDFDRVCSNCHRMLHRMGNEGMDARRLKAIVEQMRSTAVEAD